MGKVVVTEFISLDGVFEDPGGAEGTPIAGWTFRFDQGEEGRRFKLAELRAADAQLLGRVTYEGFARAWPTMRDEAGFAERMNSLPKYVVSTTLQTPSWGPATVIRGDLPERLGELRTSHPGDVLVAGSGRLVRSLVEHDLVDELRLMVFPVVLGQGRRLFEGTAERSFRLVSSQPVGPDGVVVLTYGRA
ncbi:MAG TPA: dihydrofolate reductase family protein [Candidatus Limnocylindrales bacterium]